MMLRKANISLERWWADYCLLAQETGEKIKDKQIKLATNRYGTQDRFHRAFHRLVGQAAELMGVGDVRSQVGGNFHLGRRI